MGAAAARAMRRDTDKYWVPFGHQIQARFLHQNYMHCPKNVSTLDARARPREAFQGEHAFGDGGAHFAQLHLCTLVFGSDVQCAIVVHGAATRVVQKGFLGPCKSDRFRDLNSVQKMIMGL